jgi:hypothetical protein
MPDPGQLFSHPQEYLSGHYPQVAWAFILEITVALGFAALVHTVLQHRASSILRSVSSWSKVLREDLPAGSRARVRVRLTNGTVYVGLVTDFSADLDQADREIVLGPPLYSKTGEKSLSQIPIEWQRIVLSSSNIESMSMAYERIPPP